MNFARINVFQSAWPQVHESTVRVHSPLGFPPAPSMRAGVGDGNSFEGPEIHHWRMEGKTSQKHFRHVFDTIFKKNYTPGKGNTYIFSREAPNWQCIFDTIFEKNSHRHIFKAGEETKEGPLPCTHIHSQELPSREGVSHCLEDFACVCKVRRKLTVLQILVNSYQDFSDLANFRVSREHS